MAIPPVSLAFAGAASASHSCNRTDHRAVPDRPLVAWRAPGSGGTPSPLRRIDERNPWAGVMAMRLRRAAMAIAI